MHRFNVLFIDNNLDYYNLIGITLKNYNMQISHSKSETVLNELADGKYSIVMLSLDMPEHFGYLILNKIRRFSNIPILAYTQKNVAFERINALNEGADDAISLPIESEETVSRIKAIIRRSDNMPVLDFFSDVNLGNLFLSIKTHSARVNGKQIKMTRLELSIAHFLTLHPQKIYSKRFLFNRFWGEESETDLHTVDAHIYNIRLKLSGCDSGYFKTIKKAGYKFELILKD